MSHKASRVEAILKVAERCNINCTYCYYFNMGNDSATKRPAFIDSTTVSSVAEFLEAAVSQWEAHELVISLHGGEPLLMKKTAFEAMCVELRRRLDPVCKLVLVVQTNGMLVDDEWIAIFGRQDVHVGVSVDGPREVHDRFRIDHQGRGTHDRVIEGLRRLQKAADEGLINSPGVLTVLDPAISGKRLYEYLVGVLGVKLIDVLLPHATHDNATQGNLEAAKRAFDEMFEAWTRDDDPTVEIRTFKNLLTRLGRPAGYVEAVERYAHRTTSMTIFSNGDIACDDNLTSLGESFSATGLNVKDATPSALMGVPIVAEVTAAAATLPSACSECAWQNVCHGGAVHERFSTTSRFGDKTVYCGTMENLLERMSLYLVGNGLPLDKLRDSLASAPAML